MTDHELYKYLKQNYDPPKDQSVVILIKFMPEVLFEEFRFQSGDDQQFFLLENANGAEYAVISYYDNEKNYFFKGRNYIGDENLITGEIYRWSYRKRSSGPPDPEKVKKDLQRLILFLMKSEAS